MARQYIFLPFRDLLPALPAFGSLRFGKHFELAVVTLRGRRVPPKFRRYLPSLERPARVLAAVLEYRRQGRFSPGTNRQPEEGGPPFEVTDLGST